MFMGKTIRMERLINRDTRKTVIVPMDHGVTYGPLQGLNNLNETVNKVAMGGANAVVGHIGFVQFGHRGKGKDIGLILHLSGSTLLSPDPDKKVLVNTVQHALKLGADGISIQVNIGADDESEMLKDLGKVVIDCMEWGMPLLVMVYPKGKKVKNDKDLESIKLATRSVAELGADIVKTPYTGSPESFKEVVQGCMAPVVIAGGSKLSDVETLQMIEGAMKAGAAGISMGRNAFQHENPTAFVKAACSIVHDNNSVEEALKILKNG